MPPLRVLGYMSGTSLDGVDAAILETDGVTIADFGPTAFTPFTPQERATLMQATDDANRQDDGDMRPASFVAAARVVLDSHIRAAGELLRADAARPVDLIGFHGQTVLHRPKRRLSIQLGDPAALAAALGVPVVGDLRQADLAAGGQGAPLLPIYHAALADRIGVQRPVAFLNIGGVANLSWLGSDGRMIAFDTGPGNGLIDRMVQARGLGRYDDGGRLAAAGRVDRAALARLRDHSYFDMPAPKSLDRFDFDLDAVDALCPEDAAATPAAFTVAAVVAACAYLPRQPLRWIVCGGGRHNPVLMTMLRDALGAVETSEKMGARGDFVEAEGFAYLAARTIRALPITFPDTTGVPSPATGGVLHRVPEPFHDHRRARCHPRPART